LSDAAAYDVQDAIFVERQAQGLEHGRMA